MRSRRIAKYIIRLIGALNIALALWGFWDFFDVIVSEPFGEYFAQGTQQGAPIEASRFHLMFYLLSFATIPCHHITIYVGVQLMRLRLRVFGLFVILSVFKTLLAAGLFALALSKNFAGYYMLAMISTADLLSQTAVGFPLWGPLVVYRAGRKLGAFTPGSRLHSWHSPRIS